MREIIGNGIFLVSTNVGCLTKHWWQRRIQMVDRHLLNDRLDNCILHCDERNSELRKGEKINVFYVYFKPNHSSIFFPGCLLHVLVSVCCADNIFYPRHNVRRCKRWLDSHVYAQGRETFRTYGVAWRGNASFLLVRLGFWIAYSLRKLQHTEEQLRSWCATRVVL